MKTYEAYKDSGIEWIGEIPEHWESKRIKHFTNTLTGSTPKSTEESFWNGDINWVTTDDLGKLESKDIFDSRRKITQEGYENSGTTIAPKNSIIISTRAPIGHLGILRVNACTNQGCKTIISKLTFDSEYLYYFLSVSKIFLNSLGVGTTFLELPTQSLKDFTIPFPTKEEQTAIANYLDKKTAEIDQMIADKKQLVALYQEEKKAIINQAVTKGINPNVKLKDSGIEWLGDIPEHWEVKRLKYIANVQTGRTPKIAGSKTDFFENGTINWYTPGDFVKGKYLGDSRRKLTNKAFDKNQVELFEEHSTYLVSIGATLGKVSLSLEKSSANQQINVITFYKENINPFYGYLFILGNSEMILNEADYTTLPILNQSKLNNISFAVPDKKEQTEIVQYIEKESARIDAKIAKAEQYINLLTEYRTALISEVVTGKIKVV